MRHIVFWAVLCMAASTMQARRDVDLERLLPWMEGSFSSAAQAARDTSYFDVRLHMKRIWSDRTDGAWFYVEQAMATSQDRPYRQRVYHVHRVEHGFIESAVYAFKDPKAVVGAWNDTALLTGLSPRDLVPRRGCEVILQADYGSYLGRTMGTACASDIRGASYATSEVVIRHDRIESWDRGYSAENVQVWGAVKGPYIFLRETELRLDKPKD